MDIVLGLLLINFIIVSITDYSGFPEDALKPLFKKWFGVGQPSKIFVCSYCQTVWVSIIYLLCTGAFTLPHFALVFVSAALTPVTLDLMYLVKDVLTALITFIYKVINI